MNSPTILRPTQLAARWNMSSATVRRMAREGKLPKAVYISERVFGWPVAQVEKIEADRIKAAGKKGSK
jgi:predicted DNA-binding transcriptional regulator AlpA